MSDCKIGKVQMNASSKAFLDISETNLDTLSADVEESEVLLSSSPVKLLEGSMKQNALLRLSDVEEIKFKKDESSRLELY